MAVFIGSFENKIDRKGRVSVPAIFRQELGGQPFQGIVAFRSHNVDAVECWPGLMFNRLIAGIGTKPTFSKEQAALSIAILGDSRQLPFDPEGRVSLHERLVDHAKLSDRAMFVGLGHMFQIWNPEAFDQHLEAMRSKVQSEGLELPSLTELGAAE